MGNPPDNTWKGIPLRNRVKFVSFAVAALVLGGALAAFAYSVPGHSGHFASNIPANPGLGRHRVAQHGTSLKECNANQHIRLTAVAVVSDNGVGINKAELESSAPIGGADNWGGGLNSTVDTGDLYFNVFGEGTHNVWVKHLPDTTNHSFEWHVAFEVVGDNQNPDLASITVNRACVLD